MNDVVSDSFLNFENHASPTRSRRRKTRRAIHRQQTAVNVVSVLGSFPDGDNPDTVDGKEVSAMQRRGRILVTSAISVAMLAPVVRDHDSFPLSTYPMYSRLRSSEVLFATAQGIDPAGRTHPLSMYIIGASDDPLIVAGELRAAISGGRSDERCEEIADRAEITDFVAIEIVTERHDVIEQVAGSSSLLDRTVHARCDIEMTR